jgi:hypothetical protein
LQPARAYQLAYLLLAFWPYPEVVLEEDRLPVEHEGDVGLRLKA